METTPESGKSETSSSGGLHDWRFWFTIALMSLMGFVVTVDNTAIFTALPTIIRDIGGDNEYIWIANAYTLASCAVQLLVGQLCNVFGRKYPFYISICVFAIGAGISGGASGPDMLIAGRTIQGAGCGGIFVLLELIVCDITTQRERGKYLGLVMTAVGVGTCSGPLIGGALVQASWHWVFYITLPFSGIALASYPLLRLNHQRLQNWRQVLLRIDWFGNGLFTASIVSLCFGLILGSYSYPWSSWHVLVPLILGICGWICFHIFEASSLCKEPTLPPHLFNNRTAVICYILSWAFGLLPMWLSYMLPLYFQAVKHETPFHAAVDLLPFNAFCMPFGILGGMFMTKTGQYIPVHGFGFALCAVGFGLMTTLNEQTKTVEWVFWQFFVSAGVGSCFGVILPAILASLSTSDVASGTALYAFMRTLGQVFGVTIPSVIFNSKVNSELKRYNDPTLTSELGNGKAYGAATEGSLSGLSAQEQSDATNIYTQALKMVWYGAMGFSLLAFILVPGEKHYNLGTQINEEFDIERKGNISDSDEQVSEGGSRRG